MPVPEEDCDTLNGGGIYKASICPDLVSAVQSADVSPASVSLLLTLLSSSLYIRGVDRIFLATQNL